MDWTELCVRVPVADVERTAAIAQMIVNGVAIEDYSDLEEQTLEITHADLISEELRQKDRSHATVHLYLAPELSPAEPIAFLGRQLSESGIAFDLSTAQVRELDWATAW
ncbi:MAG: 50S ribosomal protein L11 methyltransferase, partial [Oscillospiraceae bacterium]